MQTSKEVETSSEPRSLGELFTQCLKEYVEKVELPRSQSIEKETSVIVGSTIEEQDLNEDTEMDMETTISVSKNRKGTELEESQKLQKQEMDLSPIPKKLKVTCKGQKDIIANFYSKHKAGSSSSKTKAHGGILHPSKKTEKTTCFAELNKMQEFASPLFQKPITETETPLSTGIEKAIPKTDSVRRGPFQPSTAIFPCLIRSRKTS